MKKLLLLAFAAVSIIACDKNDDAVNIQELAINENLATPESTVIELDAISDKGVDIAEETKQLTAAQDRYDADGSESGKGVASSARASSRFPTARAHNEGRSWTTRWDIQVYLSGFGLHYQPNNWNQLLDERNGEDWYRSTAYLFDKAAHPNMIDPSDSSDRVVVIINEERNSVTFVTQGSVKGYAAWNPYERRLNGVTRHNVQSIDLEVSNYLNGIIDLGISDPAARPGYRQLYRPETINGVKFAIGYDDYVTPAIYNATEPGSQDQRILESQSGSGYYVTGLCDSEIHFLYSERRFNSDGGESYHLYFWTFKFDGTYWRSVGVSSSYTYPRYIQIEQLIASRRAGECASL